MITFIIVLILASLMTAIWVALMFMITKDDWISATYNKILDNLAAMDRLCVKNVAKHEKLARYHGIMAIFMKIFLNGDSKKEIAGLEKKNNQLQHGNLASLGIFDMPGYVLLRKFKAINKSGIHKKIYMQNLELYGVKYADKKTQQIMARLMSYPIIGVAFSLFLGTIFAGTGNTNLGIITLVAGTVIVLLFVYSMYDNIRAQINKRHDAISRQFPNVVSKLALLVTSGMIVDRAWKETAYSQNYELYKEMQKTSEELDNLVNPENAYGNFINRCNTKESAKLASAIIQNSSKGNAEIGKLLKEMAKEAWQERRHNAKRDAEKANSKLLIPTMLLFVAILIMIMVPVAINFTGL